MRLPTCILLMVTPLSMLRAQDTGVNVEGRYIQLSEVVIRSDVNVANFIRRVQEDTTFYKAFKNLRILSYYSINNIQFLNKAGNLEASLDSKTHQVRTGDCRTMEVTDEHITGDIRNSRGDWNYYTAELYAGLFFTTGRICGENNIVAGSLDEKDEHLGTMEKHKKQLKLLFFNPGKPIPGIPFIGPEKLDIFSKDAAHRYDYSIDMQSYNGRQCYVFKVKAKDGLSASERDNIVIDEMTTWFDPKTLDVLGRVYDMSYAAGAYDFNVHMEAQLGKFGDMLVPTLLRYNGNWKVIFKKREHCVFTATLFDFGK